MAFGMLSIPAAGNSLMDRLEAMRAFQRVVETGSFSGVAREEGVARPTIGKQISALETHLGAQLLDRTSRSLQPDRSSARNSTKLRRG